MKKLTAEDFPLKLCLACDQPLEHKDHESKARYMAKKFHNTICATAYMRENRIGFHGKSFERTEIFFDKTPSELAYEF